MDTTLFIVLFILFVHWFSDFVLQTDWQAQNKSKAWIPLLSHTGIYSLCWIPFCFIVFGNNLLANLTFVLITFVAHTITDYFTSRLNSYLWREKKVHYFFVSIGFDQLLHYAQLLLTYQFILKIGE